jgi:hypothetical protein
MARRWAERRAGCARVPGAMRDRLAVAGAGRGDAEPAALRASI